MEKISFLKRSLAYAAMAAAVGFAGPVLAVVDSASPLVSAVSPITATVGVATIFSASYNDPDPSSGVQECVLLLDGGGSVGTMTLGKNVQSDTASISYVFSSAGKHSLQVRCTDAFSNVGYGAATDITVASNDTISPTVSAISPTAATVNVSTSISASYSDNIGVTGCNLYVGGANQGSMTLSGGSASRNYTFVGAGNYAIQVRCYDANGNEGIAYGTITASAAVDSTPPTVNIVQQTSATAGVATTLSATYSDANGVTQCDLYIDGVDRGLMTLDSGLSRAEKSYTFATAGNYSAVVWCRDPSGNWGSSSPRTIAVGAAAADTVAPTVNPIDQTTAIQNVAITLTTSWYDYVGVTSCNLFVDGTDWGTMNLSGTTGGTASKSFAFNPAGQHTVFVQCRDAAGNVGTGATRTVSVSASGSDTTPPTVGQIQQSTGISGVAQNLTALYSDNVGVTQCDLYVNGYNQGAMTLYGTYAQRSYTFAGAGLYTAYAWCRDAAGNGAPGASRTISVSANSAILPGTLLKLTCPDGADANHPCKAVYYYGSDGKRHPFPNAKVYFTWYADFSTVQEISSAAMANLPLGKNVNYRPGLRMVKFQTVPKVYVVGRYGVLRWVTSEAIAIALYGSDWNQKIDDISDVFYTNYTFGADINSSGQFNPTSEANSVLTIDANL